jgi:hypothetical protein
VYIGCASRQDKHSAMSIADAAVGALNFSHYWSVIKRERPLIALRKSGERSSAGLAVGLRGGNTAPVLRPGATELRLKLKAVEADKHSAMSIADAAVGALNFSHYWSVIKNGRPPGWLSGYEEETRHPFSAPERRNFDSGLAGVSQPTCQPCSSLKPSRRTNTARCRSRTPRSAP